MVVVAGGGGEQGEAAGEVGDWGGVGSRIVQEFSPIILITIKLILTVLIK